MVAIEPGIKRQPEQWQITSWRQRYEDDGTITVVVNHYDAPGITVECDNMEDVRALMDELRREAFRK